MEFNDQQYQPQQPHEHPGHHPAHEPSQQWAVPQPPAPAPSWPAQQAPQAPAVPPAPHSQQHDMHPRPVIQVLSVRGIEYFMMALSLWFGAGALIWVLLALVNGGTNFTVLAFPISLLLVCVPIFGWLFLRLKRAELNDANLRFDPSKRRTTQTTQIIAFLICLFNVVGLVYFTMASIGGDVTYSFWKGALNFLIVLLVAGGVLAYYWNDEHRRTN